MPTCPVCGPKLSVCCAVLSVWGIIMLILLGIFFQLHSPALFEDIPMKEGDWKKNNYTLEFVHEKYEQVALNCFIAAALYVLTFVFSFIQFRMNSRSNYEMN